ncbi:MAG TPA: hypothetical protein VLT83_15350 [Opitutaceae bacterium]|nr:hypothetical protein [Opitutaceae bacterium]
MNTPDPSPGSAAPRGFRRVASAVARFFLAPLVAATVLAAAPLRAAVPPTVRLDGHAGGRRFDGIGIVNGGGATAVLLKDYPEPQRSEILDLVFKPKFGASVSALLIEIPGDGNSTQGSMPSHLRTRGDLDYTRGYLWWLLREAKKRNPHLTLDGNAWSAPGWIGSGTFWSQDAADYYVKWLEGLRSVYGLELDAIGCRNEKGVSLEFAKWLRATLDAHGFAAVRIHAFDNWGDQKLDFVRDLASDEKLRDAIGIISAHTFTEIPASPEVQALAARMHKPIWNTEEHIYRPGFDCAISIVRAFNENHIRSGATMIVNWYDVAGVYPLEPYSEDPAMVLARSPWSGHYRVREALWGYAHYGQFTEAGWEYLQGGCGELAGGGTFVTLRSPQNDYSVILETRGASGPQTLRLEVSGGLSDRELTVWRSDAREQFASLGALKSDHGVFTLPLEPDAIYSLSTTTGQQKGGFADIPADRPFPFPYREDFESYTPASAHGQLPRYFADIEEVFELADRPDGKGRALRQVIPVPPISWAPSWQPYTIIGDENWQDYEVSAEVFLNPGDTAGVMGRINHVGTGYGTIPKGYLLRLGDDGRCELVVVRGKVDPQALVGDAEQQALIKKASDEAAGGEKVLANITLSGLRAGEWHTLTLRCAGTALTGLVDGRAVVRVTDARYVRGMAGLFAGVQANNKLSTPFFDDLIIKPVGAPPPPPTPPDARWSPIYRR